LNHRVQNLPVLLTAERTSGVVFYASEIPNSQAEKIEWKGVKQFNNIEYQQGGLVRGKLTPTEVRVWKSWKIGIRRVYKWNELESSVSTISSLNAFLSTKTSTPWTEDSKENDGRDTMYFA
jgi:hypothetical protein